ncbi:hypothetical protein PoB_007465300 [Plakobranchus ocellatus]|uniref:Uncharacterized protein n=1 Tax=Plakobranchus ocellatus TaxID=259542 RepID=A0AAV4DUV5_9GAST|nr:hypothetical protein PoB_007465300 [Plakobranchus ocellatus]
MCFRIIELTGWLAKPACWQGKVLVFGADHQQIRLVTGPDQDDQKGWIRKGDPSANWDTGGSEAEEFLQFEHENVTSPGSKIVRNHHP